SSVAFLKDTSRTAFGRALRIIVSHLGAAARLGFETGGTDRFSVAGRGGRRADAAATGRRGRARVMQICWAGRSGGERRFAASRRRLGAAGVAIGARFAELRGPVRGDAARIARLPERDRQANARLARGIAVQLGRAVAGVVVRITG